jgi:hypothetical protein
VVEGRKQAVSVRMNEGDVAKVKKLANRLGVRDSDIIRFAVKSTLARLGPLYDLEISGRHLVPVFVESGSELLRFFEIDAARLEAIVNGAVESERRVDRDDLALLALTGSQQPYAALKLSELDRTERRGGRTPAELGESLRRYLYAKYLYRNEPAVDHDERREPLRLAMNTEHQTIAEG